MDEFLHQAARREVARQRITLAVQLGLEDYKEQWQDRRVLRDDCRERAKWDREMLRPIFHPGR